MRKKLPMLAYRGSQAIYTTSTRTAMLPDLPWPEVVNTWFNPRLEKPSVSAGGFFFGANQTAPIKFKQRLLIT